MSTATNSNLVLEEILADNYSTGPTLTSQTQNKLASTLSQQKDSNGKEKETKH